MGKQWLVVSNQSILKEISPGCSLQGLMLKLKFQYFGHLCKKKTHWKRPWCWERLKAGGERDDRGWDGWMTSPTHQTWVWVNPGSWWWTGSPGTLKSMGSQRVRQDWTTEWNRRRVYSLCNCGENMLWIQHSENKDHGIWSHHFMGNRQENSGNSVSLYFGGLRNHCRWWLWAMKLKDTYFLEGKLWPT